MILDPLDRLTDDQIYSVIPDERIYTACTYCLCASCGLLRSDCRSCWLCVYQGFARRHCRLYDPLIFSRDPYRSYALELDDLLERW